MLKSILSFAFQAENDYLYKEGQFLIILPNSLLPSFALRWINIVDPLDLAYDIFIAFYLELQQVHTYHTQNHYII